MVHFTFTNFSKKFIKKGFTSSKFIDSLYFRVKGGTGGNGQPKYGGIGGTGGNIICEVKKGSTLKQLKDSMKMKQLTAESGENSTAKRLAGRNGEDKVVPVPPGITAFNEFGVQLGELNKEGEQLTICRGGEGGNVNNGWLGRQGENFLINLDLKLIADIGLIGFPNAGKSTFLKAITAARPKIASYPFTTIKPNIGIIQYKDLRKISLADLPGLIEGAHKNRGMGHRFLRHVERTKLIAMIVDINGFKLSHNHSHRSCVETVLLLNKELELYKMDLIDKPTILMLNKMDVDGANEIYEEVKDTLHNLQDNLHEYPEEYRPEKVIRFDSILPISAKTNPDDIKFVKDKIRNLLDIYTEEENEMIEREKQLVDSLKLNNREKSVIVF